MAASSQLLKKPWPLRCLACSFTGSQQLSISTLGENTKTPSYTALKGPRSILMSVVDLPEPEGPRKHPLLGHGGKGSGGCLYAHFFSAGRCSIFT